MSKIKKLAIANRGEVACRIIRACQKLGIKSVLLHSECDKLSRAYRMADETFLVGGSPVNESYLDIGKNVKACAKVGADAVHPGFGFLSENAEFARSLEKAGIQFVGPSGDTIELLGDKVASKKLATKCDVPLVPGYEGEDQSIETLCAKAKEIGYPVIVKAAAGGGGRGMKVIRNDGEAKDQIQSAQREGLSAFGSEKVFLEKYLDRAKHIEFQIFADNSGTVHLFDRECSVQRRHQKIIEEACSPSLTPELRERMGAAAVRLVSEAGYRNAGTVEFLLQDGDFYFLEVNTRLQVEHPVTEMVLGIDLVEAQIRAAQGETPIQNLSFSPTGHSIECRIYAEDSKTGMPSTGPLGFVRWPSQGERVEYGFEEGDVITPFYDSMIAKLIVWQKDRPQAIQAMLHALNNSILFGLETNIEYLKSILSHKDFQNGTMTTQFIGQHYPDGFERPEVTEDQLYFATQSEKVLRGRRWRPQAAFQSYWRGV